MQLLHFSRTSAHSVGLPRMDVSPWYQQAKNHLMSTLAVTIFNGSRAGGAGPCFCLSASKPV